MALFSYLGFQVGSNIAGWLSFQPLYDWITALQPDLFEE